VIESVSQLAGRKKENRKKKIVKTTRPAYAGRVVEEAVCGAVVVPFSSG
jgi:hypothetical protein